MGAGASSDISLRLLRGETLSSLAFNTDYLFEDAEFDPCIGQALLGDRFTGADVSRVEWVRPSHFGSGELFPSSNSPQRRGSLRFDPNDCLGAITGYNRDLVVAVQLLSARRPDYLESTFECYNSQVGCAAVWLYHNGKMQLVVIDDRIPCLPLHQNDDDDHDDDKFEFKPLSASVRTGECWLPLLEKAMAKVHGSYTASALGDGIRDIIRDLTGDGVIDVSLLHLDYQARCDLFAALYSRFVSGSLALAARKSALSSFTVNDVQRVVCIAELVATNPDAGAWGDGTPAHSVDRLGNVLQAKCGVPGDALEKILSRAADGDGNGDGTGAGTGTRAEQSIGQSDINCSFVALVDDEDAPLPMSNSVDGGAETVHANGTGTGIGAGNDCRTDIDIDTDKEVHDSDNCRGPLTHTQPFRPLSRRKPLRWLSWQQFCSDHSMLTVALLPATGHVCGRGARVNNPFLVTSAGPPSIIRDEETVRVVHSHTHGKFLAESGGQDMGRWGGNATGLGKKTETEDGVGNDTEHDPDHDISRNAYTGRLMGLGASVSSAFEHDRGTAGGGWHLPTFRDNPMFRCQLARPWPRRGKLVIVLSLQDGRREGEIACRGEGADSSGWSVSGASGGKGAAGSATVDLADWDGDQEWGGSLLYPPAALRLCHDEPSLQHVLVSTDYHRQRDHTIEMDVDLSGSDYNNGGARPTTSFVIVPCLLDYGLSLPFFLSAAFIDDESGLRSGLMLSPLRSFPALEFTQTLRGKWALGDTAAGRVGPTCPYAFLNPAWRMELLPSEFLDSGAGAGAGTGAGSDEVAVAEARTGASIDFPPAHSSSSSSSSSSPVNFKPPNRDLTVHRVQVVLVLRVFPTEPAFFLGPLDDLPPKPTLTVESLAANGTTGGRHIQNQSGKPVSSSSSTPSNPRGSGGSRGIRVELPPSALERSISGGGGAVVGDDLLVRLGLEEGAAVPLTYPYDPNAYNSAVYLLTPEAYGMLVHRPTALGDCGPDEGFLGKQLFTIGAHSCRCEFLSAIRGSYALGAGAGAVTELLNRKLSIATDPTLSNPDSRQWKQRLEAFSYARKNVGYSLGSDVHDQLVLLPALWEGGVEGQFEMEVYCNLPFCLSRIDPSEINAPILTTRQKSIMAREAAAKAAEVKEKLKRIAEHRRANNQEKLAKMELGDFTLREDHLAPKARTERLNQAQHFFGTGMMDPQGEPPPNMGRTLLRNMITATMPYEGLSFHRGESGAGEGGASLGAGTGSGTVATHTPLGLVVPELSSSSVSSHIHATRKSIALKIKKDTDARLFSLRMSALDNANKMDKFEGVGDSRPIPRDLGGISRSLTT